MSKQGELNAPMLRQDIELFRSSILDELELKPRDY